MNELLEELHRSLPTTAFWIAMASLAVHGFRTVLDLLDRWRTRKDRGIQIQVARASSMMAFIDSFPVDEARRARAKIIAAQRLLGPDYIDIVRQLGLEDGDVDYLAD